MQIKKTDIVTVLWIVHVIEAKGIYLLLSWASLENRMKDIDENKK